MQRSTIKPQTSTIRTAFFCIRLQIHVLPLAARRSRQQPAAFSMVIHSHPKENNVLQASTVTLYHKLGSCSSIWCLTVILQDLINKHHILLNVRCCYCYRFVCP